MRVRGSFSLLVLLMLGACSSDKAKVEPAKLVDFQPSAQLEVRWTQRLQGSEFTVLTPAVTRNAVFAADARELLCLERDTGKVVWRTTPGFTLSGAVGAGEGVVLVGGDQGEVAAFDESDGRLRWKTRVSSEVLAPPQIADGVGVVRSGNGKIAGLDIRDGKRIWLYERPTPPLSLRSHAGVTLRNGMVYAGFPAGRIAAIGLTKGVIIWESTVSQPKGSTELERISDVASLPVADDKQVCAVAYQGRITCFDAIQGGTLWTREFSSERGLAMAGSRVYLTDSTGQVLALDKATGATLWKNERLIWRGVGAPFVLDDYLLVGDAEGYLHVLKREDGDFAARLKTDGSAIKAPLQPLGLGALVQTSGGHLYSVILR
ncbi:MAG: outer membrane protein assembly factor BamB [Sideroxydans sp.]